MSFVKTDDLKLRVIKITGQRLVSHEFTAYLSVLNLF